ncbi:hypothetical protein SAMN05428988_2729 [Chitinophaga sp. YR573]|nr:hypothetical protein SAMN05428988_2729 [Chitinophaga sp. YR573]
MVNKKANIYGVLSFIVFCYYDSGDCITNIYDSV